VKPGTGISVRARPAFRRGDFSPVQTHPGRERHMCLPPAREFKRVHLNVRPCRQGAAMARRRIADVACIATGSWMLLRHLRVKRRETSCQAALAVLHRHPRR